MMDGIRNVDALKNRLRNREQERDEAWLEYVEAQASAKPKTDKDKDLKTAEDKWADLDRKVKALEKERKKMEGV